MIRSHERQDTHLESVALLLGWLRSVNFEPWSLLVTVIGSVDEGTAPLGSESDSDHLGEVGELSRVELGSWRSQSRSQSGESSEKSNEVHCLVYLLNSVDIDGFLFAKERQLILSEARFIPLSC